jgi:hypothetical protein
VSLSQTSLSAQMTCQSFSLLNVICLEKAKLTTDVGTIYMDRPLP